MQSQEKKFKETIQRVRQKITLPKFYNCKEATAYFMSHIDDQVQIVCVNGISTSVCVNINQVKEFYHGST